MTPARRFMLSFLPIELVNYGLFTLPPQVLPLPDTDSDTNSDSNSKPNGYIVLYRNCSHCMDSHLDSNSQLLLCPFWDGHPYPDWESVTSNVNKPLAKIAKNGRTTHFFSIANAIAKNTVTIGSVFHRNYLEQYLHKHRTFVYCWHS